MKASQGCLVRRFLVAALVSPIVAAAYPAGLLQPQMASAQGGPASLVARDGYTVRLPLVAKQAGSWPVPTATPTLTPADTPTASAQRRPSVPGPTSETPTSDVSGMALMPAGTFQMGCEPAHDGGRPCWPLQRTPKGDGHR